MHLIAVFLLLFADEVTDSRALQREAVAAYKAKDLVAFLDKSRAAAVLRPGHTGLQYNLAAGLALNGQADASLEVLERIAAMGVVIDPSKDEDFASLRGNARFDTVMKKFESNAAPSGRATRAFTIDEHGILPEGLASDGKSFYVGSVRNRAIYRVRNGVATRFVSLPYGGFGMAVDRGTLWAASSDVATNRAAVVKIDLKTGRVLKTFDAPEGKHIFGDLTVAPNGDVYVSDSISPSIYRVSNGTMTPFIDNGPFTSLQGLAIRGNTMYAADYSKGIFAIDLRTRDAHVLSAPANTTTLGIDGIYAVRGGLIATQNGINPQRVVRIAIDGGHVSSVDTLLAKHPDFDDVTLGTVAGNNFYVNATGQWEKFTDDIKPKDESQLGNAIVLRLDLPAR